MLSAEPWLKSASLAGSKDSSVRPSKPGPKTMVGLVQEPRSREEEEEEEEELVVELVAVEAEEAAEALAEEVRTGTSVRPRPEFHASAAAWPVLPWVAVWAAVAAEMGSAPAAQFDLKRSIMKEVMTPMSARERFV